MTRDEFVALQRKWDARLKRLGFKDIETRSWDGRDATLKTSSIISPRAWNRWQSGSELSSRLLTFCRDAGSVWFKDPTRDRMILRMSAEGYTLAEIAAKCSKLDGAYRGKHYVWRRVKRSKEFCVKWWELNKRTYEAYEASGSFGF